MSSPEFSRSLSQLWLGSAGFAASVSFIAGSSNVLRVATRYLTEGELEGGKSFAIGLPVIFAAVFGFIGLIVTFIGLFHSIRRDHRPLLSAPHVIAFLSIALPVWLVFPLR